MLDPYIDIHTHRRTHSPAEELKIVNILPEALKFKDVLPPFISSGVHPWNSGDYADALSKVREAAELGMLSAIGETGIDRLIEIPLSLQEEIFEAHVLLAEAMKLPLIIHAVRTYPEIISIRKKLKASCPWIVHGFSGNSETMKQLIKHGIMMSFGVSILKRDGTAKTVKDCPAEFLFLETDDDEIDIKDIYQKTASLREMNLDDLRAVIGNNFRKNFPFRKFFPC